MVRGLIGLIIGGAMLLAIIAVIVARPAFVENLLPPSALVLLDSYARPAATDAADPAQRPREFPADYLLDGADGITADGPIAARSGNEPVFIADVISGYTTLVANDIPAEVTTIRPILGCQPTPPGPGTTIGHATSGDSGLPLTMVTYGDADLAAAVQTFVNLYRRAEPTDSPSGKGPAYAAYDVAVTETREPVYLVLENQLGNRIWNIHLAPGARIERVILLGGVQAGVANLDPLVPVEVILNDALAACGIQPAYPLNDGHLFLQSLDVGATSPEVAEDKLARIAADVAAYDQWFRDSFGVGAAESRIGWDTGTISVIGPVPGEGDAKAVFSPINGAEIRTTQDKFFEIRGQIPDGTGFAARVEAIATTFAYGDLTNLRQGVEF